jgi:hypothetical protein
MYARIASLIALLVGALTLAACAACPPERIQVRGAVDALQITHRRRTTRRRPDIYRRRVRLGMRRHLDLRRSARRLHDESMLTPFNLGRRSWRLIAVFSTRTSSRTSRMSRGDGLLRTC